MIASVLILMGGPDAERDVSLDSGRAVAAALRAHGGYDVHDVIVDRPTVSDLAALPGEIVFPVLHGQWGEGGPLQHLLDDLGRPYVGSGPEASAHAMDKMRTKETLAALGIATPPAHVLEAADECHLAPPLVLKPVDDGSSVDMRICRTPAQVIAGRAELHPIRGALLAERYIEGREVTVGLIDGALLPIIEIVPSVEFYDYAAKYERDDTSYVIDPDLPAGAGAICRVAAMSAWQELGCRDIARADFMIDDAGVWFLEINTMPGFTSHSLVPKAASAIGLDFTALCARLVACAAGRAASSRS